MSARNYLLQTPPYQVENAIKKLGHNLRTARLRRNISLSEMAEKIGTNRRVIADAENGKVSTGIGIYVAILWALRLDMQLDVLADPENDQEGISLEKSRSRKRARHSKVIDNDF